MSAPDREAALAAALAQVIGVRPGMERGVVIELARLDEQIEVDVLPTDTGWRVNVAMPPLPVA